MALVAVSAPQEPPKSGPVFFTVTVCLRGQWPKWSVVRRYSEFHALKTDLQQQGVVLTVELPGKLPAPGCDIVALNKRAVGIEKWAAAVLNSADALEHPGVLAFFALHLQEAHLHFFAPPESVAESNGVKEESEASSAPPSAEPKEEEEEESDPFDPTRELQECMHAVRMARLSSNNDPLAGAQDWLAKLLAEEVAESGNGTKSGEATLRSISITRKPPHKPAGLRWVHSQPASTEDPSSFARRLLNAFGSVAAGVAGGAVALVVCPVVGAQQGGIMGAAAGLGAGVIAAFAQPVFGTVGAVGQVVAGAADTPSAMEVWLFHGDKNPKADKAGRSPHPVLDELPCIDATPSLHDQF